MYNAIIQQIRQLGTNCPNEHMAQRHGKDVRECPSVPVNEYSLYTIKAVKEKEKKLGFEISVFVFSASGP